MSQQPSFSIIDIYAGKVPGTWWHVKVNGIYMEVREGTAEEMEDARLEFMELYDQDVEFERILLRKEPLRRPRSPQDKKKTPQPPSA